jgi:acetylornithine deacetylase
MNITEIVTFASDLIRIPSLSGEEQEVTTFLAQNLRSRGWPVELLPVEGSRANVLVSFGIPEIVFTTHTDVVPGPEQLFCPTVRDGRLYGRGACDTKGIIATMVSVIDRLLRQGQSNFGLLLVVGEELDGIGARRGAMQLKDRGVRYLINGEPTECKIMRAHKGGLDLRITCEGTACHSGYPHLGDDANERLIKLLNRIMGTEWPTDPDLGSTTVNCGLIQGGVAGNIISPLSEARVLFRTVSSHDYIRRVVESMLPSRTKVEVGYDVAPVLLRQIDGIPSDVAAYCTDIPNFDELGAECVLYGPGSILDAHTDSENIALKDIEAAVIGYEYIFHQLRHPEHRSLGC